MSINTFHDLLKLAAGLILLGIAALLVVAVIVGAVTIWGAL